MRIAKMGYSQRVTVKDEQGRVTSSWSRVRIVVPDGLSASLPPPYTSLKHLTKKVHSSVEHAEWTARFLALVDQARGWGAWHGKLRWLDSLCFEDRLRESPALLSKYDDWLDKVQGVTPARKKQAVTGQTRLFRHHDWALGKEQGETGRRQHEDEVRQVRRLAPGKCRS